MQDSMLESEGGGRVGLAGAKVKDWDLVTQCSAVMGGFQALAHGLWAASVLPPYHKSQENRATVSESAGTVTNARSVDSPKSFVTASDSKPPVE